MAAERQAQPIRPLLLDWRLKRLTIPRVAKSPGTESMMEEIRRKAEPTYLEKGWICRYDAWDPEPREVDAPVQCLRIGSTAIVGLPAEIFTAIAVIPPEFGAPIA